MFQCWNWNPAKLVYSACMFAQKHVLRFRPAVPLSSYEIWTLRVALRNPLPVTVFFFCYCCYCWLSCFMSAKSLLAYLCRARENRESCFVKPLSRSLPDFPIYNSLAQRLTRCRERDESGKPLPDVRTNVRLWGLTSSPCSTYNEYEVDWPVVRLN